MYQQKSVPTVQLMEDLRLRITFSKIIKSSFQEHPSYLSAFENFTHGDFRKSQRSRKRHWAKKADQNAEKRQQIDKLIFKSFSPEELQEQSPGEIENLTKETG